MYLFNSVMCLVAAATALTTANAHVLLARDSDNSTANILRNKFLRIQPLGASITAGEHSSGGNGYRKPLRDLLHSFDNRVQFVGSQKHGNMTNPENEGHSGWIIADVGSAGQTSADQRPNVILFFAGHNDMLQGIDLPNAPERVGKVVDDMHASCPDAAIFVAQLSTVGNETIAQRIHTFNAGLPAVMKKRMDAGIHVMVLDFEYVLDMPQDYFDDLLHPVDSGYEKFAGVWLKGLRAAAVSGWIGQPKHVDVPDTATFTYPCTYTAPFCSAPDTETSTYTPPTTSTTTTTTYPPTSTEPSTTTTTVYPTSAKPPGAGQAAAATATAEQGYAMANPSTLVKQKAPAVTSISD